MSELDDLLKTLEGLPTEPEAKREWVDERSEDLGDLMARAAGEITEFAATAYAMTLVAAGDIAALDGIEKIWYSFTTEVVGEYTAGMYLTGNLSAFVGVPGGGPPPEAAAAWASVVNENAVAYQAAATNRIVGASTNMWQDVRGKVTSNIQDGMTAEQTKSAIEEITGYSEFRADAIGRTEVQGAYAGGEMDGARALGEFGPTEKSWLSATDARTRESHLDADGQTVTIDEMFLVGGTPMDRPLDPGAPASEVVNCRCVVQLLYPGDARPDGSTVGDDVVEGEEVSEANTEADPNVAMQDWFDEQARDGDAAQGLDEFIQSEAAKAEDLRPLDKWAVTDDPTTLKDRAESVFRPGQQTIKTRFTPDGTDYETDTGLADLMKTRDADGLPSRVSAAVADDMIADGAIEVFRGASSAAQSSFAAGEYEAGLGVFGNGFYTSTRRKTGQAYAEKVGFGDGSVSRIVIDNNSKIADFGDLRNEWTALDQVMETRKVLPGRDAGSIMRNPATGAIERGNWEETALGVSVNDLGRLAATKGYDVMRVPGKWIKQAQASVGIDYDASEDFYVILNRAVSAVVD